MNHLRIFYCFAFAVSVAPCILCPAGQNNRPSLNSFVPDDTTAGNLAQKVAPVPGAEKPAAEKPAPIKALEPAPTPVTAPESTPVAAPVPMAKPTPVTVPVEEKPAPVQTPAPVPPVAPAPATTEPEKKVEMPTDTLIPAAELTKPTEVFTDEIVKGIFDEGDESETDAFIGIPEKHTSKKEPIIYIKKNEKLSGLIDKIAAKQGINVIMPHGSDIIKEMITFDKPQKLSLSQAITYLHMFLNMSGYRMRPDNGFFVISKITENNLTREALPLFVNVPPQELPQNDMQIRAIYYLANFRVPSEPQGNDPLNLILKDMLGTQKSYLFDRKTNSIILIAPSRKIASVMKLVLNLDNTGTPDELQVIPLFNSSAPIVAKLLNEQIIATAQDSRRSLRNDPQAQEDFYFAPNTRVVADPRTNSLIVLGQGPAVQRIRDLVRDYIDLAPESGKSILHVYDLQYLRSRELADQLTKIVSGGDSEQSRKEAGGPQKFFDDVKIIPEEVEDAPTVGGGSKITSRSTIGGNRLIVAATSEDWKHIKSLIEQLDKPEYQVILEVMIVDLTVDSNKALKSQTRNPSFLDLPAGFQFQSAQMTTQILDTNTAPATTLASDLLRLIGTKSIAQTQTSGDDIGSMIISLRDPNTDGIWSVLEILDKWVERKVLSHPFFITKNNYAAHETNTDFRRNLGSIVDNNSSVTSIKYKDYTASLSVDITPRISSLDRLNMQIKVKVENFVDTTGENTVTREMETNASLGSGQILVIGGLSSVADRDGESGWPLISKLPIIGNLFKASTKGKTRTNLAIFIHPTIIDPKLRSGLNKYTADGMKDCDNMFKDSYLFSSLRDPITRIFLNDPKNETAPALFEKYNRESASKPKPDSLDTVAVDSNNQELEEFKERIKLAQK